MISFKKTGLQVIMGLIPLFCFTLPMAAQTYDFIRLDGTEWTGTVFGDVGGMDKLTSENFEISQDGDSFTLASRNNRGKLSSSTDGIAFLYKMIPADADFEMSVTVEVKSFEMNNQVSFGIMLRDTVYENFVTKENFGSYLANGPINITADPAFSVFYRTNEIKTTKMAPMTFSTKPAAGESYEISFIKEGDSYILTFGDEDPFVIDDLKIFSGDELYIGLYTSRNTEVEYSDISLEIE